ncbi:MAG: hypothetical protein ACLSBH_22875 [Coprobacillus cateniformis]
MIADFARVGRCKKLRPFKAAQHIALKRLTRERYHLAEQLIREKNYVLNNIYLKVSGLMTLPHKDLPFSDNFSASNTKFLTDYASLLIWLKNLWMKSLNISNLLLKTDVMIMVKLLLFLIKRFVLPIDLIKLHMTL